VVKDLVVGLKIVGDCIDVCCIVSYCLEPFGVARKARGGSGHQSSTSGPMVKAPQPVASTSGESGKTARRTSRLGQKGAHHTLVEEVDLEAVS